ncbi:ABC transporter substrate-binding protein [Reinekea marinisedimentorum]|uniref:Putative spermidine/putrescine transport system substrate-binding protein n=1 Tax=Reinekea marinisedimentorum TaxID=230495 RepID=A0A4V2UJ60_9GAMM|nr:extracellular solute-binding protein [Reinekea marinisedimentorum]TCS38800.1 putative spermidine/putrescine transport system substrate-binding protein [Reinekea marinisedimentorum]
MKKFKSLLVVAMTALPIFASASDHRTLVVSTWDYDVDALKEFLFTPFEEKHNVTIELDLGRDSDRYTKLQNEIYITDIDVFLATQATAQKAINDGLFETMNKAELKNYGSLFEQAKNPNGENYGPSYTINRLRVAGNSEVIPSTWAEILADKDSKIAIPHMTSTFGPMVLYGTGDVSGDASANVEAIESWVSSGKVSAYVSTFSTRKAVINGEFDYALLADFGYTPDLNWGDLDKVMLNSNTVNIVKGSKNADLAMEFIDFLLSVEVQNESLDRGIDSPVNKNVQFEEGQEDAKTNLASFPDAVSTDIDLVNKNRAAWVAKWNELFTR